MNNEYCLLSIILNYPEKYDEIKLYKNIFNLKETKELYDIIIFLSEKENRYDKNILLDYIQENKNYNITKFYEIFETNYTIGNFNLYLNNVLTKKIKNELKEYLCNLLNNKEKNFIEIKLELQNIIDNSKILNEDKIKKIDEICRDALANLYPNKIKSYINYFDENQGGFEDDELIILAARPGVGKTQYAKNLILKDLKNNRKIGFISAEVGKRKFVRSMACTLAGIDINRLDNKDIKKYPEDEKKIINQFEVLYEKDFYIDDSTNKFEEIIQKIKIMKNKMNVEKIYIDHLHHLESYKEFLSDRLMLSYMVLGFKQLVKELNIPIILLAQLNRDAENKRPQMSELKGSGKCEEIADICILLYEYQNNIDQDFSKSLFEMIVDKNRNGKEGVYKQMYLKSVGRFVDLKNG